MKYLVTIVFSLLGFSYVYGASVGKDIDNLATKVNHITPIYAIVFDAGSTATRVNFFEFHRSVDDGQLVLDDSVFIERKPGLSAYAKNPKDVEKSLNALLDEAKAMVPRDQWASTPISLRATAGLRLLPGNEAQTILDETKRVLASSGFKVSNDSVDIMSGTDEGIFSWVTVNFLLGNLNDPKNTVAALDLGGASNQVTYSVEPDAISKDSPQAEFIHYVSALGKNISVFSESFLGMGLNAAKEKILTHQDNPRRKGSRVWSECVNPALKWEYAGKTYWVSGARKNTVAGSIDFDKCTDIIKKVVHSAIPHDFPGLKEHKIYAISTYFRTALNAGLIQGTGGIVTLNSFHKKATEVCENPDPEEPFMCLDLSYIYVLLHDGFGLDDTSNIFIHKYINGHGVSWALGVAFELLQNDVFTERRVTGKITVTVLESGDSRS